jgi:hypothetical protein
MPDATPNYGWRTPKSDGTDYIIPDDVRIPINSIDTQMKTEENARVANTANTTTNTNNIAANTAAIAAANAQITALNKMKVVGGTSTTSGGGHLQMNHGQASIPTDAIVTVWKPTGGPGITWQITSIDATSVFVQCWDTAGAAVVNTSLRWSMLIKLP